MVKPNGKRPLGKPRKKWENNMTIGLADIVWDGAGWIKLSSLTSLNSAQRGKNVVNRSPYLRRHCVHTKYFNCFNYCIYRKHTCKAI